MNRVQWFFTILTCIFMVGLLNVSIANKDLVEVSVMGQAQVKTRVILVSGTYIVEKDWWIEITLRNYEGCSLMINPSNFTIVDSVGNSYHSIAITDIPKTRLITNTQVQPSGLIRGLLGFTFASNNSYPKEIIYESSSTITYGKVYMNDPPNPQIGQETTSDVSMLTTGTSGYLSPQDQSTQWAGIKANKEATIAKDSVFGELDEKIVKKYISSQRNNKRDFENKNISFDQFMVNKDNFDQQKEVDTRNANEIGQRAYNETFTKGTTAYYQLNKF